MVRGEGKEKERKTHDASDALDLARVSGPLRASLDDAFEQPDRLVVRRDRGGHVRRGLVRIEGDRVLCALQRLRQQLARCRRGRFGRGFSLATEADVWWRPQGVRGRWTARHGWVGWAVWPIAMGRGIVCFGLIYTLGRRRNRNRWC